MEFYKKAKTSIEDLEQLKEPGYEIYGNLNHLSSLSKDTKLIIVGSFVPSHLNYFYEKNDYMYKRIDVSRDTKLETLRLKIKNKEDLQNNISKMVLELKKQRIAFFDMCEFTLTKINSSKDPDIKAFVFDKRIIDFIKINPTVRVVAISRAVETTLKRFGIKKVEYYHFFVGGPGTNIKDIDNPNWIELFDNTK